MLSLPVQLTALIHMCQEWACILYYRGVIVPLIKLGVLLLFVFFILIIVAKVNFSSFFYMVNTVRTVKCDLGSFRAILCVY